MTGSASEAVTLHALGVATAQGSRPSQQDRHIIFTPDEVPSEIGEKIAIFGVFDGHGSHSIAKHAQLNMLQFLLASPEFPKGNYEQAMQAAIDKEEKTLFQEFKDGKEHFAVAGSTASLVILNLSTGVLVVGNLGDSHVLLAERDPSNGELRSIRRLTEDHKPDGPDEKQRIEDAGGEVHSQNNTSRIGAINMSRALGDLQYKAPLNNMPHGPITDEQTLAIGDPSKPKEDFLSTQISSTRVELKKDGQYLLALTSDGITNALQDKNIMHSMSSLFGKGLKANEVAEAIVKESTDRPGSDNATFISVFLKGDDA
ncbi:phosphatase 2C-like domain-containing protein [Aspergillus crustosus]